MSYVLPPDIQERVRLQVESGDFACEADVLREAITELERRQEYFLKLKEMVAEADEAIANGQIGVVDREEIKREVRQRLAAQGITD